MAKVAGPAISVVIPAYNASDTVITALESVMHQSEHSLICEIIVINDGSTDMTLEVLSFYAKNHRLKIPVKIINQVNLGVSAARNAGILSAKGNWIALLDADDQWHPQKIEKSMAAILQYPFIETLGTNRQGFMRTQGKAIGSGVFKLGLFDELVRPWPTTSSLMIRKSMFDSVGLFDEARTHAEDVDLLLRIAAKSGVHYLYESLLIFSEKGSYGVSGLSKNLKKMHEGCVLNIKAVHARGDIGFVSAYLFMAWEFIKYVRRIITVRLGRVR